MSNILTVDTVFFSSRLLKFYLIHLKKLCWSYSPQEYSITAHIKQLKSINQFLKIKKQRDLIKKKLHLVEWGKLYFLYQEGGWDFLLQHNLFSYIIFLWNLHGHIREKEEILKHYKFCCCPDRRHNIKQYHMYRQETQY